jgi:hypothetical protein
LGPLIAILIAAFAFNHRLDQERDDRAALQNEVQTDFREMRASIDGLVEQPHGRPQ